MKNKRIFGERDFRARFEKVLDRFDVQNNGVYLAEVDTAEADAAGLSNEEKEALFDYPDGSLENPVLPFPFSYADAERFSDEDRKSVV